ncbi:MAG: VOC family protein [Terriglobia bacterium]|jgi:predicted 3-demethylubiquinone-9 3-methyltransferase (glyoxalase superfamily)|nr:VOC family protein [Terriglobia bacterium]
MKLSITTFLMFDGKAEEAINFYISLFPDSGILSIDRYASGEGAPEGSVKTARVKLAGQTLQFFNSPMKHGFTFTPAISLFVECDSEADIERLFNNLSQDGQVLMPLNAYPFSTKFGWCNDRFGVSWQLNFIRS